MSASKLIQSQLLVATDASGVPVADFTVFGSNVMNLAGVGQERKCVSRSYFGPKRSQASSRLTP